ncbi:MAG: hypothetical protein HZY75_13305 [Nocardioidaceae bacterium]|nr:MAG: hypothetical protein HZY75_13305 [Nocardioidaceae bacterium]
MRSFVSDALEVVGALVFLACLAVLSLWVAGMTLGLALVVAGFLLGRSDS